MRLNYRCATAAELFALAIGLMAARADIKIWNTTTGAWSTSANWVGGIPVAGDDVVITNTGAYVYLTNSTFRLSSMAISNATLSFSNWDTTVYVTNLTIRNGGILTCWGPFTNTAVSNRVNLNCAGNLIIETGGSIYVKGKGFSGGINIPSAYTAGHGPGGGIGGTTASGGSYGGAGSVLSSLRSSSVYGSAIVPLDPGSGGAGGYYTNCMGGSGGGAVCVTAAQIVVNGSINADAYPYYAFGPPNNSTHSAGGSGGGIYITCSTITGANGVITACGGDGKSDGGGGGGGRISIMYDPAAQSNAPVPSIRFSTASGIGPGYNMPGDIGTLYFPDNYFLSPTNIQTGQWLVPGFTNWSVANLLVSNAWIRLPGAGFQLTVANTLAVIGTNYVQFKLDLTNGAKISCNQCQLSGGTLIMNRGAMSGPTLSCSGDLALTNSSRFYVYGGLTNADAVGFGALVSVAGDIQVTSNSWIYPAAHSTNGAATLLSMHDLTINRYGGIDADYLGYAGGAYPGDTATNSAYGDGAPAFCDGAGYGGKGGQGSTTAGGGPTCGSSNAPVTPGSGARAGNGGSGNGASGGGSVQIRAANTVTIQGTITANGQTPSRTEWRWAGASGGSIYIICRTFIGDSNGVLRANGGEGQGKSATWGGGGGGGRIAVWRIFDNSPSVISNYVNGGSSWTNTAYGTNGTIVWGWRPPDGTIFMFH